MRAALLTGLAAAGVLLGGVLSAADLRGDRGEQAYAAGVREVAVGVYEQVQPLLGAREDDRALPEEVVDPDEAAFLREVAVEFPTVAGDVLADDVAVAGLRVARDRLEGLEPPDDRDAGHAGLLRALADLVEAAESEPDEERASDPVAAAAGLAEHVSAVVRGNVDWVEALRSTGLVDEELFAGTSSAAATARSQAAYLRTVGTACARAAQRAVLSDALASELDEAEAVERFVGGLVEEVDDVLEVAEQEVDLWPESGLPGRAVQALQDVADRRATLEELLDEALATGDPDGLFDELDQFGEDAAEVSREFAKAGSESCAQFFDFTGDGGGSRDPGVLFA